MVNETSRRLFYHGPRDGYRKWADTLWNRGFSCPLSDVAEILKVSERWIEKNILKDINYIVYSSDYIWKRTHTGKLRYVDMSDVAEWIEKYGVFLRQTEFVDLYGYLLAADRKNAESIKKDCQKAFDKGYGNTGILPVWIMDRIRKEFIVSSCVEQNVKPLKRSLYPWKETEHFNIFEREFYFPEGRGELLYRNAFLNGDTKVIIGTGKTVFVRNTQKKENYRIPFLVPYGSEISVH